MENPATPAPKNLYKLTVDPVDSSIGPAHIEITFVKGIPHSVEDLSNKKIYDSRGVISYLNALGGEHGIGRIDIVENRYIGLKVSI